MNTPSKCHACGSSDLIWFTLRNTGGAQGEPLRMPEIAYDFILGCKECSETLRVLRADDVAEYLTLLRTLPAQGRAQSAAVSGAQAAQSASDDVFEEGQWWLEELDSIVANGTPTQRRAMAVVRNLLSCWQRVQAAAVPEGWRRAVYHAEECLTGCLAAPDIARGLDVETVSKIIADLQATRFAMLAAAPAQPAAHHIEQALDMVTPAKSEVQRLREALTQLLSYAERQICAHDNTHRGGAIWEICDDCGAKWADDEGGKPEFKWPNEIEAARAALAASTGQEVEK